MRGPKMQVFKNSVHGTQVKTRDHRDWPTIQRAASLGNPASVRLVRVISEKLCGKKDCNCGIVC